MAKPLSRLYAIAPFVSQRLLWLPTRLILKFFCRFAVYGRRNLKGLPRTHGTIFVANHSSELDPPIVNAAFRFTSEHSPLFFASDQPESFKNTKKFGWRAYLYRPWFFKMLGAYPVYTGKRNFQEALPHQIALLEKGESLLFFPEGKRTPNGQVGKAHPGIGFLLHYTNAVIIPVAISGTYGISLKTFLLRKHTITVTFGTPIERTDRVFKYTARPQIRDFKKYADIIMERVARLFAENPPKER